MAFTRAEAISATRAIAEGHNPSLARTVDFEALALADLDTLESILADVLVTRGFDQTWGHNDLGRHVEELLGWVVSMRIESGCSPATGGPNDA